MAGLLAERFSRGERRGEVAYRLKSLACIGVADGGHEETQAKSQYEDVQHGILLVALASKRIASRMAVEMGCGKSSPRTVSRPSPRQRPLKCHCAHMFSRRRPRRRYRNPIKAAAGLREGFRARITVRHPKHQHAETRQAARAPPQTGKPTSKAQSRNMIAPGINQPDAYARDWASAALSATSTRPIGTPLHFPYNKPLRSIPKTYLAGAIVRRGSHRRKPRLARAATKARYVSCSSKRDQTKSSSRLKSYYFLTPDSFKAQGESSRQERELTECWYRL